MNVETPAATQYVIWNSEITHKASAAVLLTVPRLLKSTKIKGHIETAPNASAIDRFNNNNLNGVIVIFLVANRKIIPQLPARPRLAMMMYKAFKIASTGLENKYLLG